MFLFIKSFQITYQISSLSGMCTKEQYHSQKRSTNENMVACEVT